MDASTWKLRGFVAVAEELHFSRAAARLNIAQQALSRQVQDLEAELGTKLFLRTSRSVEMTPAGSEFLAACRDTLKVFDEGVRAARRVGGGEVGTLALGFYVQALLELTTPVLQEFARRCPGASVDMREYTFSDPSAGLGSGETDLAVVRLPVSEPAMDVEVLFTEPRVVCVSTDHRLATRRSVTVADLADEPMTISGAHDTAYRDFWTLAEHRSSPPAELIETTSHLQELEIVATGRACSITAACASRFTPRAGIRFVALADVPGVRTALAWRRGELTPLAARFVEAARAVRDADPELVRRIEHPDQ